jgi:hypothetical protein
MMASGRLCLFLHGGHHSLKANLPWARGSPDVIRTSVIMLMHRSSCRKVAPFFPGKTLRKISANRRRSFACSMSVSIHRRMVVGLTVGQGVVFPRILLENRRLNTVVHSRIKENEDGNTLTGWLEYLVVMKGARRERNATDILGPAPGVATRTLSSSP